jgi:ABC-2 type transport system permease protein
MGPVLRISWLALIRDRWALALSFLVPVAFFSILALVFGGADRETLPAVRVVIVDEDRSGTSELLLRALAAEPGLTVQRSAGSPAPTREEARRAVRRGEISAAVVVPEGFGRRFEHFPAETLSVEVLCDRAADPVAQHVVAGLLQRAVVLAAPDRLVRGMARWVEEEAGPLAASQRELVEEIARSVVRGEDGSTTPVASPFHVAVTDVQAERGREGRNAVSYYAAAIGVMFLLFTMTTAMRGLITEKEAGTLERLLGTDLTMRGLLAARWLFATTLGCVQLAVMLLWGWAAFGVELFGHGQVPGLLVMTVAAAAAAATLGLVLGAACRTQAQLQGLATVVILLMSALGGSMVPRYLMPETMQRIGLVTFNAWAVKGFEKVLWHHAPLAELLPEVSVLGGMTLVGLIVARHLARRWESV